MHYPSHHQLTVAESKEIERVLKFIANKKLVKQQIQKKFGKVTTLKDIQNIRARAKISEQQGWKDALILLNYLAVTLNNDPQASGGLFVDDEDDLYVLYYQSEFMAELFKKFPEIVLVDGTYNVNKARMLLYLLWWRLVIEGFLFMQQSQKKQQNS